MDGRSIPPRTSSRGKVNPHAYRWPEPDQLGTFVVHGMSWRFAAFMMLLLDVRWVPRLHGAGRGWFEGIASSFAKQVPSASVQHSTFSAARSLWVAVRFVIAIRIDSA